MKYNFKEYDPITQKNRYKANWKYNLRTISEAKEELAKLQTGKIIPEDKDITLEGIHEVWKVNAESENFSVITLRNTEQQMNMIYQFLPKDTKLKNITEEVYRQLTLILWNPCVNDLTMWFLLLFKPAFLQICFTGLR